MEQYKGKSIFKKMAIGKIFYYEKNQTAVKREKVEDVEQKQPVLTVRVRKQKNNFSICLKRHSARWGKQRQRFLKCI